MPGPAMPELPRHDPVGMALSIMFQKGSALAQWYRARTVDARQGTRKSLIVAMARKLLIELWRFVTTGQTPVGVEMRPV